MFVFTFWCISNNSKFAYINPPCGGILLLMGVLAHTRDNKDYIGNTPSQTFDKSFSVVGG
jgi:hypothetical protein